MRKTAKRSNQRVRHNDTVRRAEERKKNYTKSSYQNYAPDYMYTSNALQEEYNPYIEQPVANTKRKKKKVKPKTVDWLHYVPTLVMIFALGVTLVMTSAYKQELAVEVSHAKEEVKTIEMKNGKIEKQIALTGELRNVEAIAIYNMEMRPPAETEIIYLPPREEKVQSEDEAEKKSSALEKVKEVIGMIMR